LEKPVIPKYSVLSTSHQKQPQRQWPRRQVQLRRIIQTQPQQQLTPLGKQRLKAIQQYREILSGSSRIMHKMLAK
jgi:hypothetical protein